MTAIYEAVCSILLVGRVLIWNLLIVPFYFNISWMSVMQTDNVAVTEDERCIKYQENLPIASKVKGRLWFVFILLKGLATIIGVYFAQSIE